MPVAKGVPAVSMSPLESHLRKRIIVLKRRLKRQEDARDSAIRKRNYNLKSITESIEKTERELEEKKAVLRSLDSDK